MPSITIHPPSRSPAVSNNPAALENALPTLLHTPSGLALVEIQGTVHFPASTSASSTQIGKLVFPLYNPAINGPDDVKWMKRVYLYVGNGQRMSGECKKLAKPLAVIRKRESVGGGGGEERVEGAEGDGDVDMGGVDGEEGKQEELEIVEIVRFRIVFSLRPEPISGVVEEG
ncbi:hypothetical protein IQ07DRAFT_45804 [Pyrenochaeta sp. DS3sAY3a]|nr:hypothetical protein IQ07DRAFT_45804 [Pyrenochaeta sp. DS3sAY3a]